jgi:dipeptidyl-peptidase-4
VQRLPRKQDRMDLLLVSATTGTARTVVTDTDSAYVDVEGEAVRWLDGGRHFLLRSDRDGWRRFYLYDRAGRLVRAVTPAATISSTGNGRGRSASALPAAAPTPWCASLPLPITVARATAACTRVTRQRGHVARARSRPAGRLRHRRALAPRQRPTVDLPSCRRCARCAALADNSEVRERLRAATSPAPQLVQVPLPDGTRLDAYRSLPPGLRQHAPASRCSCTCTAAPPRARERRVGRQRATSGTSTSPSTATSCWSSTTAARRGGARASASSRQLQLGVHESQDQIDAARWVGQQSWGDPARVGIWGWSYGGFTTAMALGRGGSVFKAGIAVAPVVDWRYYDTIYTERFMWTPQENAEGYRRGSVLTYLPGMTARLLLVHGTGDDNVHPQNAIVLAAALQELNKPFTMMLYPNRTHSISGGRTQLHLFGSLSRFVLENL